MPTHFEEASDAPVRSVICDFFSFLMKIFIWNLFSAAKIPLELQVMHIYFDSSTFDKVEKDAKVKMIKFNIGVGLLSLLGLGKPSF